MNTELTGPDFRYTLAASNKMHPLETYLEELRAMRSSGAVVKETSGYGAWPISSTPPATRSSPKSGVSSILKNSGAGLPDGGLFTPDQLKNTDEDAPLLGIPQPSRGVIEVKATNAEVDEVADTLQVREYISTLRPGVADELPEFSAPETRRQRQTRPA